MDKIAEISKLYKKHCPRLVGTNRTIYELRMASFIGEIKALIEQEQKPMREALHSASNEINRLAMVTGYEGDKHFEVLRQIDAVLLKGEGK